MNILLVNDDGYGSTGIKILQKALVKYGEVFLVAPTHHQSGKSMSFSICKGFEVIKYNDHEYSVDGTPVDVTLLATQILDKKFDLVVSGVNNGHNIGYESMYSGTVGAALEGLNRGIPSIALSTDTNHFDIVSNEIEEILDYLINNKLYSNEYCINVNFPTKEFESSKGIKFTKESRMIDKFYNWKDENGLVYTDRTQLLLDEKDEETDIYAIAHGYISITLLQNSFFSNKYLNKIKRCD